MMNRLTKKAVHKFHPTFISLSSDPDATLCQAYLPLLVLDLRNARSLMIQLDR